MDTMQPPQLADFLEQHLLQFVMPFWLKHALDEHGGINTCIGDDGEIRGREKFMWSQTRAVWVFSALYNRIEKKEQWLDIAGQIYRFCVKHGRDGNGHWIFRADQDGGVLEGDTSIYVDGFAIIGLTEYFRATGDSEALAIAEQTAGSVMSRLAMPGYASFPYPIPAGLKAHAISMIFSYAFDELSQVSGDPLIGQAAAQHARQVMDHFRHPEKRAVMEFVKPDGSVDDSAAGRWVMPGHAIESMWFQIRQFQRSNEPEQVARAIECIRWHLELGWDREFGGIVLAVDLEGKKPAFGRFADAKLWWVQLEAMYALLLAHSICGESWCMDWYWKVHEVAFKHYPVAAHGEWTQKLDRQFTPIREIVALPVKDPFHLPRTLIMCVELLRRR